MLRSKMRFKSRFESIGKCTLPFLFVLKIVFRSLKGCLDIHCDQFLLFCWYNGPNLWVMVKNFKILFGWISTCCLARPFVNRDSLLICCFWAWFYREHSLYLMHSLRETLYAQPKRLDRRGCSVVVFFRQASVGVNF